MGHPGNFRKAEFEKDMLLIVNHINTSPVNGNDDVISWKWRPGEFRCFIESANAFHAKMSNILQKGVINRDPESALYKFSS